MSDIKPVRTRRSRISKQVSPNGLPIVYVGRPTKFGNPFKVGDDKECGAVVHTREAVIQLFRNYAEFRINAEPHWLDELRGKNLSCWCGEDELCHADVLLELANK